MKAHSVIVIALLRLTLAAQDFSDADVIHPDQRIDIRQLLSSSVRIEGASVPQRALALVLKASDIACAKESEVEMALATMPGQSLEELVNRISGTLCNTSSSSYRLTADLMPYGAIQPDTLIASLLHGKPLLIGFRENLYVLCGIVYDEHIHPDGSRLNYIHQLVMIDPRYQDKNRVVVFSRDRDKVTDIKGFLSVGYSSR